MFKAGKIIFLVMALLAILGAVQKAQAYAAQNLSSCASQLVSTPLCEEIESQACSELESPQEEPKQIQAVVIIAEAQHEPVQARGQATPAVLPTMTPLQDEYAPNDEALDSDRIFDLVNQYRASQGLFPFEKDDKVCEFAQIRSAELSAEVANGTVHAGLYGRNLPFWIWENAKVGSTEEGTVAWWLASPLHHQSIVGDYKFSCVKCTGTLCSQLFTSFSPK